MVVFILQTVDYQLWGPDESGRGRMPSSPLSSHLDMRQAECLGRCMSQGVAADGLAKGWVEETQIR